MDLLFDQFLHPDAVWRPVYSHEEEHVGREGFIRGSQAWIEVAGD